MAEPLAGCELDHPLEVPPHYFAGACFVCKLTPTPGRRLSRCAKCQMIKYCSKEHQRLDWPLHKTICKRLRNDDGSSVLADGAGIEEPAAWLRHRASQTLALRLMLGRELHQHEKEMIFFPPVCEVCHKFSPVEQVECDECHCAVYCGPAHASRDRSRHARHCAQLKVSLACDRHEALHGLADPPILPDVDSEFTPLPENITDMLTAQILAEKESVPEGAFVDPVLIAFLTERLSFPLTLLYSLMKVNVGGTPIQEAQQLVVHVVGAQMLVECLGIIKWEYLVHRLPRLESIRLVFVGPELFRGCGDVSEAVEDSGATRCEECVARKRTIVHELRPTTYHEYCAGTQWTRPDVVVCFNSGIHEFAEHEEDTWAESLPLLMRHAEVPLIVTAYTRTELLKDLEQLERAVADLERVVDVQKNPFSSTKPVRDMCREDDSDVFYLNQYLAVVRSGRSDAVR